MPSPFPDFIEPVALPGGGHWTAVCESFNPREESAYYFVTVADAEGATSEFFAEVHCPYAPSLQWLQPRVHEVAVRGETNTAYTGSLMWKRRRKRLAQEASS